MTPADRIKQRRIELKLNQVQAARLAGISQGSWSDIERGITTDYKAATMAGIVKALKTTSLWIMSGRGAHDAKHPMSEAEELLLALYEGLSTQNRSALLAAANALFQSQGNRSAPDDHDQPTKQ